MKIDDLEKKFELNIRNFDYVEYCGCQYWKPYRNFDNFPYTYKDLGITKKQFEDLKDMQRKVWLFADTLLLDHAQNNEHILDYCFHGQRMGWKQNDELWLVYNIACNRFEIRYPDLQKWDPLDKYIVDKDLTIHVKLGYLSYEVQKSGWHIKNITGYIQVLSINSFPDRIELNLTSASKDKHFLNIAQIFNYLSEQTEFSENVNKVTTQLLDENLSDKIKYFKQNHNPSRYYNFEQKEQKPEDYWNIFLKFNHQLKFWQNKKKNNKK